MVRNLIKKDHHCPWLSICIGALNHKKFIILIIESLCFSIYIFVRYILIVINFVQLEVKFKILTSIVFTCVSIILLFLSILITYQLKNISNNSTTSENLRSDIISIPDFDNGLCENIKSFNSEILSFKKEFTYNRGANLLLKKSVLLYEYLNEDKYLRKNVMMGSMDCNETYDTIDYKSTSVSL